MLNALRMEAYRMRKTVSTWMVFLVLAALTVGTTFILRGEYQDAGVQQANYEYMESSEANENQNLGMSVTLPTEPGHRVTLYDFFYANSQGKFLALFFCIYAVMYTGADRKSGYIKAIGGQVKNRSTLVLAKAVMLALYTIVSMAGYLAVQALSSQTFFGYLELGPWKDFLPYLGMEVLLHIALVWIVMALTIILANNVASMTAAILLCMNVMTIFYSAVTRFVAERGPEDFNLLRYTVTGEISLLPMHYAGENMLPAVVTGLAFCVAAVGIGSIVFQKRDIR